MQENTSTIPYVIIGAGIIGLQVAYELMKKGVPGSDIVLFEQNLYPGEHSSSRNSGVLHAGLYYEENSLKQKFCLEGNELWNETAKELNIPLLRPGKFLVATSKSEVEELERLYEFARKKGVPGLEWNSGDAIKEHVHLEKTFFSKNTGIIGISEAIRRLSYTLQSKGVHLFLNQKIEHVATTKNGFELEVGGERIEASALVNCAGLFGIKFREKLGLTDLKDCWVKGRYLRLKKKFYHESLIYPIPQKGLKGLGVHTSFDLDGVVRFGPDTWDINDIDYAIEESAIENMFPAISQIFKGIQKEDLVPDYAGIRSKILENGKLHSDFWIKSPLAHYWECLGIESPGLTSSPAIGKYIASKLLY